VFRTDPEPPVHLPSLHDRNLRARARYELVGVPGIDPDQDSAAAAVVLPSRFRPSHHRIQATISAAIERGKGPQGPHVDVLVNNAAVSRYEDVLAISPESWAQVIAVNLSAPFFWSQEAARGMAEAGAGRIVNIASVNGLAAEPRAAHYVAAKTGLIGLTRALAVDLARSGVTVNAVCPGPVRTDKNADLFEHEPLRTQLERVPAGRLGLPRDVAAVVAWLASADASFINGQTVVVDGGLLASV
jgi:NAD(P)-dependent dehydrogenase (short-subunit alcohol dehydrogenase family)